jgi:LysR family transcriptional regulator, glycine cleavage system transcriptional activator
MADRLPPLSALRAFNAAARNLSFTRAGLELNVTQAAVSYQVRRLEDHFGIKLFHRLHRALALTEAGQAFFEIVGQAFNLLAVSGADLTRSDGQKTLSVSVSQSLSSKWLIPRLEHFRAKNPQLLIHIDATDTVADLAAGEANIALRYAQRIDPALNSILLFPEQVFPVCSPALLEGALPLNDPQDLQHHTLIHDDMTDITWPDWLGATGIKGSFATHGPSFSHSGLAIDAAIEGQGIVLGRSSLIIDDLSSGRLVRLFDITLLSSFAYYAVFLGEKAGDPLIAAFIDWLMYEAKQSEKVILGHILS